MKPIYVLDSCPAELAVRPGSNPPVLRLKWRNPEPNIWVRCADSFEEFADMLGLDKTAFDLLWHNGQICDIRL